MLLRGLQGTVRRVVGPRIKALDSIRAIAVVCTVGVHMPGSPVSAGGRAMFFALSGFLIGGMLLRQAEAGRLQLLKFWAARARRLFPALLVLLVAALAFIRLAPNADTYQQWAQEGFWAALYGHNLYLISINDNYFDDVLPSPLGHIWSLSAEEQFYILFPFVVLAAMGIARLRRTPESSTGMSRVRLALLGLALAGMFASGAFAFANSSLDASAWSYYDLRARAGALFAGVILACVFTDRVRQRVASWNVLVLNVLGFVALAGVLAVMFGPDSRTFYLQFGIPILVLCTLVLIVVAFSHGPVVRALSVRPVVGLGLISYGVYLWAIPIAALWGESAARRGMPLPLVWLIVAVATVLIAVLSYKLVEMPVRNSKFLAARPGFTLVSGIGALGVVAFSFAVLPSPFAVTAAPPHVVSGPSTTGQSAPPALVPCGEPTVGVAAQLGCVLYDPPGGSSATVLVVGASNMRFLANGLIVEAASRRWRLLAATEYTCPLGFFEQGRNEYWPIWQQPRAACAEVEKTATDLALSGEVDVVVGLDMSNIGRLVEAPDGLAQLERAREYYRGLFRSWAEKSELLLVLDYPTLDAPDAEELRAPLGGGSGEKFARDILKGAGYVNQSREFLMSALPEGAHSVDLNPILCPDSWPCPWEKDGVQLRFDQTHVTIEGSYIVAPMIAAEITEILRQQ